MIERILQIIRQTFPAIAEQDLKLPIRDVGIDSLDLVMIRVAFEKHFGYEVPDTDWYQLSTLNEVINYFTSKGLALKNDVISSKRIFVERQTEITMPQMANNGLSENWLLKELGDLHWQLLSEGIEQKSSAFKDETGNRLYATFIRIAYSVTPLGNFKENDRIGFSGTIKRFGNSTYLSNIDGKSGENFLKAILMTTFSVRSLNDNSKIEKSSPKEKINHIEEINTIPKFFNDYRLLRKNLIGSWEITDFVFPLISDTIFEYKHIVNPYYEINGVGLLYFAAYPIISDLALSNFCRNKFNNADWVNKYQTIRRDINYFANCNANETIVVTLNSFEVIDNRYIKTITLLSRLSDQIPLAKIFTVKQKLL